MREYCNPVDLTYKFQHYGAHAHREAADPTLVLFKGRYYMFASMSAGFYWSEDMLHWQWHENRELDMYRYAPDVRQVGEYLYFSASTRGQNSTIWRTQDPMSDVFEKVSEPFAFWDPDLFCDDDGRVYFYWGCGNVEPIWGVELDPATMLPLGEKVACIDQQMDCHGWERGNFPGREKQKHGFPMNLIMAFLNRTGRPYMEGAFMNKWNGKYYLQYAAPGTEVHMYGDGYYVGDSPLGPFTFAPNTPFSLKPSGFITGAGHGSTIEDEQGNLWHAATMRISANQNFERRVGLFPAGLDEDGLLFCNQNFADYPIVLPEGKFDPRQLAPHYMLLSYKKAATASSSLEGHGPGLALDENIRTWWCAQGGAGQWYQLDMGAEYAAHSIQLNFAEEGIPVQQHPKAQCSQSITTGNRYVDSGHGLHTRYILEGSLDGQTWQLLDNASQREEDRSHPYLVLPEGTCLRYVKITAVELPYNASFALSGVRVFGLATGEAPAAVQSSTAAFSDAMTATISWAPAKGAMGYNVRYGIGPEKLYTSYLVYEANQVFLTGLNAGQDYWVCVDSFNERGITPGQVQKLG